MAQLAPAPSRANLLTADLEFVQLKDGSLAWLNATTGELTAAVRQPEWDELFALLEKNGPAPAEFMNGIEDPMMEDEEIF